MNIVSIKANPGTWDVSQTAPRIAETLTLVLKNIRRLIMTYAQHKRGQKLHLVFEADGKISQPICGKRFDRYRMTINLPLANACRNCQRIYKINGGGKIRKEFFKSLMGVNHD